MRGVRFYPVAAAAVLLLSTLAAAEVHVQHPAYLRALAELRFARAHLSTRGPGMGPDIDEQVAITQIDKAMKDVRDASEDDGKNLDDHPPVELSWGRQERLRRALEQLTKAHDDIELRQQDSYWKGLKANDAQDHIAEARQAIEHAMNDKRN